LTPGSVSNFDNRPQDGGKNHRFVNNLNLDLSGGGVNGNVGSDGGGALVGGVQSGLSEPTQEQEWIS
jgi:hypothetical protein